MVIPQEQSDPNPRNSGISANFTKGFILRLLKLLSLFSAFGIPEVSYIILSNLQSAALVSAVSQRQL